MRILLADDHALFREGLRRILTERLGWSVCGEAGSGLEAVAQARRLRPDLVVLDFSMPGLNGVEAARQIRGERPNTQMLLLTMFDSELLAREAAAAGIGGVVLKSEAGPTLVAAVERLCRPEEDQGRRTGGDILTPREREVLRLIAEGGSSKMAADRLGISVKTAETHRANLMRKLRAHSVSELVHYAIRIRLVEP